jgi:hypothetical protein
MNTRRKSSVKAVPNKASQRDAATPATATPPGGTSTVRNSKKSGRPRLTLARTLKLEATGPQLATDPTLEELLQIKPAVLQNQDARNKEQVSTERVEEAKEALGKLECEIVSALFPSSGSPASFEEIAQRLGMTVKEVREVADDALRGLRSTKSSRSRISTVWN